MDDGYRARVSATLIVVLLVATGILHGCNDVGSVGPSPQRLEIVPLSLGNLWILADTSYDVLGNVQETSWSNYPVTRDTVLFGQRLFSYWGLATNADSGLIIYQGYTLTPSSKDTTALYRLLYKYPASQGETYGSGFIIGTTDTLIHVPAGAFHCINYRFFSAGELSSDHFVSTGVGLVKIIDYWGGLQSSRPYACTRRGPIIDVHFEIGRGLSRMSPNNAMNPTKQGECFSSGEQFNIPGPQVSSGS